MAHASLKSAIDLMHVPSQVRRIRERPLPDDMVFLLRIAAGDEEATTQGSESVGRSPEIVRDAAAFFVEQILLFPEADSYRVLGARSGATRRELKRNVALLLRWLHPDVDPRGERSVFAARVARAWNDLKTPERRAAYDRSWRLSLADKSLKRDAFRRKRLNDSAPSRRHVVPGQSFRCPHQRTGLLRWLLFLLFDRMRLGS
jgi:hypothetical protein